MSLAASLALAGCVIPLDTRRNSQSATIQQITSNPDAWADKHVTVEGILVWDDNQSRLYPDQATAAAGSVYDPSGLSIRMSEVRGKVPKSLDAKRVRVTADVDASCIVTHLVAKTETTPNKIVWASGYCHTATGPDLVNATAREARP